MKRLILVLMAILAVAGCNGSSSSSTGPDTSEPLPPQLVEANYGNNSLSYYQDKVDQDKHKELYLNTAINGDIAELHTPIILDESFTVNQNSRSISDIDALIKDNFDVIFDGKISKTFKPSVRNVDDLNYGERCYVDSGECQSIALDVSDNLSITDGNITIEKIVYVYDIARLNMLDTVELFIDYIDVSGNKETAHMSFNHKIMHAPIEINKVESWYREIKTDPVGSDRDSYVLDALIKFIYDDGILDEYLNQFMYSPRLGFNNQTTNFIAEYVVPKEDPDNYYSYALGEIPELKEDVIYRIMVNKVMDYSYESFSGGTIHYKFRVERIEYIYELSTNNIKSIAINGDAYNKNSEILTSYRFFSSDL